MLCYVILSCRSAASSSQQIIPYDNASSAKSLTVALRPLGKSVISIENSNGPKTVRMSWLQEQMMPPQLVLIECAVIETIRTSLVVSHEFRNTQVSSKDDDEELCQTLLKSQRLRRELFC